MRLRKPILILTIFVFLGATAWSQWPPEPLPSNTQADRVLISKSDRSLEIIQDGRSVMRYRVSFGANPDGHKEREGDERTPEGRYLIDYRKPDSSFHKALHISYPNTEDQDRARSQGHDPGGLIMIHGLPNRVPFLGKFHRFVNWTDGCIAVTNREMDQIWDAVADGTPVEILP